LDLPNYPKARQGGASSEPVHYAEEDIMIHLVKVFVTPLNDFVIDTATKKWFSQILIDMEGTISFLSAHPPCQTSLKPFQ
jgi:hypothetical protein